MGKSLVVITGASSGIGAGVAKQFSETGYNLALLARNVESMEAMQLPNACCIATDVTDIASVKKAIAQAEDQFGPVQCLVNNAGVAKGGEFTSVENKDQENMVQVNLLGVINCIEAILPGMQQRKSGTILNMSSLADRSAVPNIATYAATKSAVKSLTESLRMANAQYGIRICNIAPALIATPMLKNAKLDESQVISVENLAKMVLWMYQQPESICIRDIVIAPTSYES